MLGGKSSDRDIGHYQAGASETPFKELAHEKSVLSFIREQRLNESQRSRQQRLNGNTRELLTKIALKPAVVSFQGLDMLINRFSHVQITRSK